jgi:AraC-like DNA-binding protein
MKITIVAGSRRPRASVERIAEAVGYRDSRAFIRAFGVVAGISPGQYRQKFKQS